LVNPAAGVAGALVNVLARPAMTFWYASVVRRHASLPRPDDAPVGHAPGHDPMAVLIVGGDGPAVGWGVRSHGLALPGQLARELSAATARGVDVDLFVEPSRLLAGMPEVLAGRDLSGYEAILVIPGAREAITLAAPSAWRHAVTDILVLLREAAAPDARLVFVGSQPIRSIPAFDSPIASLAAGHRNQLNRIAEDVCRQIPGASYVKLPGSHASSVGRYRTPEDYQFWARTLAQHVAAAA
jgi:hypothetical protein